MESDDLTERGSEFQTEQVFGTNMSLSDKMADSKDDGWKGVTLEENILEGKKIS